MSGRYTVLGLARPRASWFSALGQWASTGTAPIVFVRCVSKAEVRARLSTGTSFSAVVVDGSVAGTDRDLFDVARNAGCAAIVVDDGGSRDWRELGADAVLPTTFTREDLLATLDAHATGPADIVELTDAAMVGPATPLAWRGRLVAFTGIGGSGTSTLAAAFAQELADDPRDRSNVLLADFRLRSGQAMAHGSPDVVPGVSEMVDAHRTGRPDGGAVRAMTFDVPDRGYRLLLGLRRARDWAALRPRSIEVAMDAMLSCFRHVVVDVEADVEGETETGSVDVEERNALARCAIGRASAVVVVGRADLAGLHALVRLVHELASFGVATDQLIPTANFAPRSPKARAALSRAYAELVGPTSSHNAWHPLVPITTNRRVEAACHDQARLPRGLAAPLIAAVATFGNRGQNPTAAPVPLRPGAIGLRGDGFDNRATG